MKLDFIEIGCADFRTEAEKSNLKGISVEPVKEYFDRLPIRDGLIRINKAVSNIESVDTMFYYSRSSISKHELPHWFGGCHCLGKPHISCCNWLTKNGFDWKEITEQQEIETIRIKTIFETHGITEVDFLKIDTEGLDYLIMMDLFDLMEQGQSPKINRIKYESNVLMKKKDSKQLRARANSLGYEWSAVIERGNEDTVLKLKV